MSISENTKIAPPWQRWRQWWRERWRQWWRQWWRERWRQRWRQWWRQWWRALLCEVVAGLQLELVARLAAAPRARPAPAPGLRAALALGGAVLANVHSFGRFSGGYANPSVSLAAAVAGRMPWPLALGYVAAHCSGAALGFRLAEALGPVHPASQCDARPADAAGAAAVVVAEAGATAALVLFACAAWRPAGGPAPAKHPVPPADAHLALKFGLVVAGMSLGAGVNPARAVAAAAARGCWRAHWLHWAGPGGAAPLAAALYRYVLAPVPRGRAADYVY